MSHQPRDRPLYQSADSYTTDQTISSRLATDLPAPGRPGRLRSTIRLVSSLDILAGRLPDGTVNTDPGTLREHAIDSWSLALLRRVRGWIAASSAGQASTGFGAIEDVLLGLTAVLPDGEILRLRPVPRSAAGPDLRRLLVGSEGTLAVVTEATLACRPRPPGWEWLAFGFEDF